MDTRDIDGTSAFTAGLGGILIVLTAGLLGEVREDLGPANVALILTIMVVGCAALGGRFAGGLTGAVAALSFDFWHTAPYNTLRMDRAKDIETVVLLLIIGIVAGELTHLRDRYREEKGESDDLLETVLTVSHLIAGGASLDEVWRGVKEALSHEFGPVDCRFDPVGTDAPPLPRIASTGVLPRNSLRRFLGQGFELPVGGAELAVTHGRDPLGRIVVVPRESRGVSLRERRVGVALAEQFAIVLWQSSQPPVLS